VDETAIAIANLQRLAAVFTDRRRQLAAGIDLTEAQWRVLEEVGDENFLPSLFARRRSITAAAVSRTLRQLLQRDLVRCGIGTEDGRQRRYALTARGRRALVEVAAARAQAVEEVWARIPRRDLATFSRVSGELAERLERYAATISTTA
jgi:DNA-binding MarR family transcriptional regulator